MAELHYKGIGQHSVKELEVLCEQNKEEIHLLKSQAQPKIKQATALLEKVKKLYLLELNDGGNEPKANLTEIIKTWEEVNEFLFENTERQTMPYETAQKMFKK